MSKETEQHKVDYDLTRKPDINTLGRTYGYIKGQQFSLNRIRKLFPDLENEVTKSELEFSISFKKASDRITKELEEILGNEFRSFEDQMAEKLKSTLGNQKIDKQTALLFFEEIKSRAKGNIESPVLETLLTYQFIDTPEKEFLKGYVKTYSTKGHPKSKGVTINSKLPLSWKQQEGDRPNIIQKFVSENGSGQEIVLFMVKDLELPSGYKITQSELDDFFVESELREMIAEGSEFISAKRISLDNHTGGQIIYKTVQERLDFTITMQSVQFITIYNGKMIFLQCMVSAEPDENLTERFDLFLPIFRQIANSMILMDQY